MRAIREYAADLHMHSTFSDGLKTPDELCKKADQLGLTHIALSDHDTMDGLPDMHKAAQEVVRARILRGDDRPFVLIPCVELSTGRGGRTHLLGYGANASNAELTAMLRSAAEDRMARAERMLALLEQQGIEMPPELRQSLVTPHSGRAHIARALVQMGTVHTMQQAFDRYLAEGRSAYVPRQQLDTAKAVQVLSAAGAVPVLAHPMRLMLEEPMLHALIAELMTFGLRGMEVYHPSANRRDVRALELFARRMGLLVTGGSDYHGDRNTRVHMGRLPSGWSSMPSDLDALLNALHSQ